MSLEKMAHYIQKNEAESRPNATYKITGELKPLQKKKKSEALGYRIKCKDYLYDQGQGRTF